MARTKQLELIEPPEHLSERSKALWAEVTQTSRSAQRLALVQTALEALDRADEARQQLDVDGLTVTTKTTGAVHVHPLTKTERENRALFARLWAGMGLSWDRKLDGQGY